MDMLELNEKITNTDFFKAIVIVFTFAQGVLGTLILIYSIPALLFELIYQTEKFLQNPAEYEYFKLEYFTSSTTDYLVLALLPILFLGAFGGANLISAYIILRKNGMLNFTNFFQNIETKRPGLAKASKILLKVLTIAFVSVLIPFGLISLYICLLSGGSLIWQLFQQNYDSLDPGMTVLLFLTASIPILVFLGFGIGACVGSFYGSYKLLKRSQVIKHSKK